MSDHAARLITFRGTVYPAHCDHMGHMNVSWYVIRFDEASWNLFHELGVTPSYLREQPYGMAGVQQNISYKQELFPGDVIEVSSRVLEVREKLIRFEHVMRNIERDEVAAVCELSAVHMDQRTRKACPFPPAVLATAEALLAASR
jgi:acyl-CoA thioester hydrolase